MKLSDWLAGMIDGMPDDGSIILTAKSVRKRLSENGPGFDHDFTVEEVGKFFNRSPVTIRAWIRDGRLRAYRFQGREYRVCESAVEELQQQQREHGAERVTR